MRWCKLTGGLLAIEFDDEDIFRLIRCTAARCIRLIGRLFGGRRRGRLRFFRRVNSIGIAPRDTFWCAGRFA